VRDDTERGEEDDEEEEDGGEDADGVDLEVLGLRGHLASPFGVLVGRRSLVPADDNIVAPGLTEVHGRAAPTGGHERPGRGWTNDDAVGDRIGRAGSSPGGSSACDAD
jgi:hypothetical protein